MELDLERIINLIVVLGGSATAILTAIVTARKTLRDTDAKIDKEKKAQKLAEKEFDLKEDKEQAELTDRLQALYLRMTEDFEKKFICMQKEMDEIKQNAKDEREEMKAEYNILVLELESSRRRERAKTEAGILLIKAIESFLAMRSKYDNDPQSREDYEVTDVKLLATLKEVKDLFQSERQ